MAVRSRDSGNDCIQVPGKLERKAPIRAASTLSWGGDKVIKIMKRTVEGRNEQMDIFFLSSPLRFSYGRVRIRVLLHIYTRASARIQTMEKGV